MSLENFGRTWITTAIVTALACLASTTASGQTTLSGEVLAPSDSLHYEFVILTAAMNVNGATVTATATWGPDWYLPPPIQHTASAPNLVEVPYLGGFGCDFIRNYPQNNFVEFQAGMDPTNPNATKTGSIRVGPGKAVAIAGSDCFFGDNFTFHTLVKWTVQFGGCQLDPGSLRWFAGFPLSADHHRTSMNGIFRPSIGGEPMSLAAAAQACGLAGFNWEQKITQLPCPSPFFPNNPIDFPQNLCPVLNPLNPAPLMASPQSPLSDPPKGGYANYILSGIDYSGYDPYPYVYYWDPNANFQPLQGVSGEEKSPTGVVIDHRSLLLVTSDDMQLAFYDAPANSYLAVLPGASDAFATSLMGVDQNGNPSSLFDTLGQALMWTWTDNYNHTSGGVNATFNTGPVDPGGTGGITITSGNGVPQTPPSVSCTATPNTLWPPNGKLVPVTISGTVTAGTQTIPATGTTFAVNDEYGQDQPTGGIALDADGSYSFTVPLIAERDGSDLDGRTYTINVIAADAIGNVGSCSAIVTVLHDQGH